MTEADGPQDERSGSGSGSATLIAMVDESAFVSAEHQEHVQHVLGDHDWDVDAQQQAFMVDRAAGGPLLCRAHLVGTAAPGPGTWLWGWEDVNGFPEAFVAAAREVRDAGAARGCAELTAPELPLTEELPLQLVTAAKTVTGVTVHYAAPLDGGTRVWLLIEHPDLALPAPTVMRAIEAIGNGLGAGVQDHRAALTAWARRRAADLGPATGVDDLREDQEALLVQVSDGAFVVTLDALGRIDGLRARLSDQNVLRPQQRPAGDGAARPGVLGRLFGRRR